MKNSITKKRAKQLLMWRTMMRFAFKEGFSVGYDRGTLDGRMDYITRSMLPWSQSVAELAARRWVARVEKVAGVKSAAPAGELTKPRRPRRPRLGAVAKH